MSTTRPRGLRPLENRAHLSKMGGVLFRNGHVAARHPYTQLLTDLRTIDRTFSIETLTMSPWSVSYTTEIDALHRVCEKLIVMLSKARHLFTKS